MRSLWTFGLLLLGLVVYSTTAHATACFDWNCDETTAVCTFDAGCSTANPNVWKYNFIFGDGTETGLTGNSVVVHGYPTNMSFATVTVKVFAFDDPTIQQVSCDIVIFNAVGPPLATNGSCSN